MSQTSQKPSGGSPAGTPRWVKVLGIIFIVVVLAVVALHLSGTVPWGHHMP